MHNNLLIGASLILLIQTVNGQLVQYAGRFRNLSLESETGSGYLIRMNIYQDKHDHKISAVINITKDIHIKNIEAIVNRCSYEKSDCENFQRWKFPRNLKSVVFMKNQIWSSIFSHITPTLDLPHLKKNIYTAQNATLNSNAIIKLYPEAVNYFWRVDAILNDYMDKKALIIKFEGAVITFVERNKKRNRGGTHSTNNSKG